MKLDKLKSVTQYRDFKKIVLCFQNDILLYGTRVNVLPSTPITEARPSFVWKKSPTALRAVCHTDIQINLTFNVYSKGKGKVRPRTGHEGPEGEQSNRSTLSLTSALDGYGWSKPCPGRFTPPPGKETRYPLCRRLGGPQVRLGRVQKISPPLRFDPRTSSPQRVAIPTTLSRPTLTL